MYTSHTSPGPYRHNPYNLCEDYCKGIKVCPYGINCKKQHTVDNIRRLPYGHNHTEKSKFKNIICNRFIEGFCQAGFYCNNYHDIFMASIKYSDGLPRFIPRNMKYSDALNYFENESSKALIMRHILLYQLLRTIINLNLINIIKEYTYPPTLSRKEEPINGIFSCNICKQILISDTYFVHFSSYVFPVCSECINLSEHDKFLLNKIGHIKLKENYKSKKLDLIGLRLSIYEDREFDKN